MKIWTYGLIGDEPEGEFMKFYAKDDVDALLRNIRGMTNADDPRSYRCDDREGCLDTVFSMASKALGL